MYKSRVTEWGLRKNINVRLIALRVSSTASLTCTAAQEPPSPNQRAKQSYRYRNKKSAQRKGKQLPSELLVNATDIPWEPLFQFRLHFEHATALPSVRHLRHSSAIPESIIGDRHDSGSSAYKERSGA